MAEAIAKTGKAQLYGVNFNSDVLRPESGAVLDEVVKLAQANPDWHLEIGGHTDIRGEDAYNQKLSERRAASVMRYLIRAGVAASRLAAKGYGASRPLIPVTGDNRAASAQNRRVELVKR
jgi:outer membrane protein OmpA-like peptidoglycan-associated protein